MVLFHQNEQNEFYERVQRILKTAHDDSQLFQAIVNAPFHDKATATMLGLGIVVLLLVSKKTDTIDRIALSNTEHAKGALDYSVKNFEEIKIPLAHAENVLSNAIRTGKPQVTTDWKYLFVPELTAEEARFNQAGAGISCSHVYPFTARDGGALIFSFYELPQNITDEHHKFMADYRDIANKALA